MLLSPETSRLSFQHQELTKTGSWYPPSPLSCSCAPRTLRDAALKPTLSFSPNHLFMPLQQVSSCAAQIPPHTIPRCTVPGCSSGSRCPS